MPYVTIDVLQEDIDGALRDGGSVRVQPPFVRSPEPPVELWASRSETSGSEGTPSVSGVGSIMSISTSPPRTHSSGRSQDSTGNGRCSPRRFASHSILPRDPVPASHTNQPCLPARSFSFLRQFPLPSRSRLEWLNLPITRRAHMFSPSACQSASISLHSFHRDTLFPSARSLLAANPSLKFTTCCFYNDSTGL
jgi:hypothetical protein